MVSISLPASGSIGSGRDQERQYLAQATENILADSRKRSRRDDMPIPLTILNRWWVFRRTIGVTVRGRECSSLLTLMRTRSCILTDPQETLVERVIMRAR